MSELATNWVRLAANVTNLANQNVRKLIIKSLRFFFPNWGQYDQICGQPLHSWLAHILRTHSGSVFFSLFFFSVFLCFSWRFLLTLIPLPPSLCCFIYKYKPHSSMTFPQQSPRQFFPHSLQGSWISYFGPKWVNLAIMGQIYDFLRSNLRTVWLRK